jgi:hypothetical protein
VSQEKGFVRSRRSLWALAVAVGIGAAAFTLAGAQRRLQLQHSLLLHFQESSPVVTLEVDPVGEIPMFLHPDDEMITRVVLYLRQWEPKETQWFVRSVEG